MINELIKLASHLDAKGRYKEADYLDGLIRRVTAQSAQMTLDDNLISEELSQIFGSANAFLRELSAETKRAIHKDLRFSPNFQFELTRADSDQAEIDELNRNR